MHLTSHQVDDYWSRKLAPAALLALDRHIAVCEPCREALQAAAPPAAFRPLAEVPEHLEYEQIEEYVNGGGSTDERGAVERHIKDCEGCRSEVEDLNRFRREYRTRVQRARREQAGKRNTGRWWFLSLGSAVAACILLLVIQERTGVRWMLL